MIIPFTHVGIFQKGFPLSKKVREPLEIAHKILREHKTDDWHTLANALKIAYLVCEHQQAVAIANS
jgi:hypothetical protein